MFSILIAIFLAFVGYVITLYTQEHLREKAYKNPNTLLSLLFTSLDKILLSESNFNFDIESTFHSEVVNEDYREIGNQELLSSNFDPLENRKKVSYSNFDVNITFLKPNKGLNSAKKFIIILIFSFLTIPSLVLFFILLPFVMTETAVTSFFLTFLVLFYVIIFAGRLGYKPVNTLMNLMFTKETIIRFIGEKISVINPSWHYVVCNLSDEPKFLFNETNNEFSLAISYRVNEERISTPLILFPWYLSERILSQKDFLQLEKNLNEIISHMYVKKE